MRIFAAAVAVASVVIALAAAGLSLSPVPSTDARYLLTSLWCVLPLAWGCWALLTPKGWLPQRLPAWGAILGGIAALFAAIALDLPSRVAGRPVPVGLRAAGIPVAVAAYFVLWILVRSVYGALGGRAPEL